ncbi:MAG: LytR/AlgR family response regulator transcription factor [Velocimicrobium sp.]
MKIAVCDDNKRDLSNIVSLLNNYKLLQKHKHIIEYTTFHNAVDLIAELEIGHPYDVVLLDILMPHITGIDAAKEIRKFNQNVKIIFMTSSPEFAVASYSVSAYYYALKPVGAETLNPLLDKLISEMEIEKESTILVKGKGGLSRIFINRLEFAEVIGKTIFYHITDGSVIQAVGSMTKLENELLTNDFFIKPHRSYIINLLHINTLGQREIKMHSLAIIPLAKANSHAVKSAYIASSFKDLKSHKNI